VFITSPIAGHLLGRAAYYSGVPLSDKTVRDDLKTKQQKKLTHHE
jgi:multicomponent Na+:H+ antiporter subunit G